MFAFNGSNLSATTNRSGVASVKSKAPTAGGSFVIGISFAGDTTYAATSTSAALSVRIATKLTYTGPTKAGRGAPITLSATLLTTSGTAIAGQTVSFTLAGVTHGVATNGSGVASWATVAPTTAGKYTVGVAYAGDAARTSASALQPDHQVRHW